MSADLNTKYKMIIAVEGINGSGKSFFIENLQRYLQARGRESIVCKMPMYEQTQHMNNKADAIKAFLSGKRSFNRKNVDLMFKKNRLCSWKLFVQPAIDAGKIVILDRSVLSGIVYADLRALAETHNPITQAELHAITGGEETPSLFVFLDTCPSIAVERLKKRKTD